MNATTPLSPWTTPLYNSDGEKISNKEARKILDEGGTLEDPNAGANSRDYKTRGPAQQEIYDEN